MKLEKSVTARDQEDRRDPKTTDDYWIELAERHGLSYRILHASDPRERLSEASELSAAHFDVSVPHDEAHQRIQATVAAGGTLVYDAEAPAFWVLADPEGNEACITTWQGRDG